MKVQEWKDLPHLVVIQPSGQKQRRYRREIERKYKLKDKKKKNEEDNV